MKVTSSPSRCAVIATAASLPHACPHQRRAVQILPGSRPRSTLTLCSAGTSARARANARRRSDAKPSAPANRVREIRSFSLTSTASCTCGSEAVWLAASNRRARSAHRWRRLVHNYPTVGVIENATEGLHSGGVLDLLDHRAMTSLAF